MKLKRIELYGFKSFAERTVISLSDGITSIVGPNGSGKSNISDCLAWVMGEQSVRNLRGGTMQDVIFAGTAKRNPLSYASVSIVIDNAGGEFDLPYEEVIITRKLYRSGESEYLINDSACRLKDIHELLMDTGLGRDGYSIIGQGKIAEILSNKPDDRRQIFEEAAGISKFRYRREETIRKLGHTEDNLVRIDDILCEIQMQIEP
ncbi:MAG: AAA family ATPase, partial [Oscillospiraceae bacterium]|nr:AAA family ATPase [Oscillospiraceae bacterium]